MSSNRQLKHLKLLEEQAKEAESNEGLREGEERGDDPRNFFLLYYGRCSAPRRDQFRPNNYYARLRDLMGYDKEESRSVQRKWRGKPSMA